MIETILWLTVIALGSLVAFIGIGFLYATIYDWWYWRKYGAWVTLKHDHTRPRKPLAK